MTENQAFYPVSAERTLIGGAFFLNYVVQVSAKVLS
jgi:hypothetical protein